MTQTNPVDPELRKAVANGYVLDGIDSDAAPKVKPSQSDRRPGYIKYTSREAYFGAFSIANLSDAGFEIVGVSMESNGAIIHVEYSQ